ncbi:MAG: DMT family transporter [Proteobacteria bacterium]|nr:DMT family transporter [Pseudomonadota bacterium]
MAAPAGDVRRRGPDGAGRHERDAGPRDRFATLGIDHQLRDWPARACRVRRHRRFARRPAASGRSRRGRGWGGLLGAVYVASVTILGPRLGGMTMVALVIAGQLMVALVVDQFGILGYPQIAVTPTRLLGAALLLAGAVLVMRR